MILSASHKVAAPHIRELSTAEEIGTIQRLRYAIWKSEGVLLDRPEFEVIADHHDDHAAHWGVFDGEQLVGAARLCLHDQVSEAPDAEMFNSVVLSTPVASMNRLVVLKQYRHRGIARLLDEARVQKAREWSARTVIVAPIDIESRKRSLGLLGFEVLPDIVGWAKWSPGVKICACYLVLRAEKVGDND
jgi:GNAT superfamily N-acetyltransferase